MAEHHIYFTRHGWSEWNEANKICGVTDIPLTEKGRAQARELGQKCLDEKLDFDTILASPLKRAYETAEIVAEMTGKPLLTEPRLIEQNFGRFEGTPRDGHLPLRWWGVHDDDGPAHLQPPRRPEDP